MEVNTPLYPVEWHAIDCDEPFCSDDEQCGFNFPSCAYGVHTNGAVVAAQNNFAGYGDNCDWPAHPGCTNVIGNCFDMTYDKNSKADPVQYMTGGSSAPSMQKPPMCVGKCPAEFLGVCDAGMGGGDECYSNSTTNMIGTIDGYDFWEGFDVNDNDPYFFRVKHTLSETVATTGAGTYSPMTVVKNLTLWTKEGAQKLPYTFSSVAVSVADGVYINWDTQTTSTTAFTGWDLRIKPLVTGSIGFQSYLVSSVERLNLRENPSSTANTKNMARCETVLAANSEFGKGPGSVAAGWVLNTSNYIGFRWEVTHGSGSYKYGWMQIIVGADFTDVKLKVFCLSGTAAALVVGECSNCFPNIEPHCYALVMTVSVESAYGACYDSTEHGGPGRTRKVYTAYRSYHAGSATAAGMLAAQMKLFWMLGVHATAPFGGGPLGGDCNSGNPLTINQRIFKWDGYEAASIGAGQYPGFGPDCAPLGGGCDGYIGGISNWTALSLTAAAEVEACNGGEISSAATFPFCFDWVSAQFTITGAL